MHNTPDYIIDCTQDFTWDLDVDQKASTTGEYTPYTGITGVTFHISATRGGPAIDADVSGSASVRSGKAGRIYGTVDVAALQEHLLPLRGRRVYLVIAKDDEIVGKSFECLVQA